MFNLICNIKYGFEVTPKFFDWLIRADNNKKRVLVKKPKHIKNFKFGYDSEKKKYSSGYVLIYDPNHPFARKNGYVFEHRLVWEEHHMALLLPWVVIHHKNKITNDNRIENLEAMIPSSLKKLHPKRKLESVIHLRST